MDVLHWDKVPESAVVSVSQFRDGSFKGTWGIKARLPDGRDFWVLMSDPPDLVSVPNPVMCQSILTNLRSFELPDPRSFPIVHWDEVPESARLQERQFRGEIWGILAVLPDGDHLVMFDSFAQDAGYQTFFSNRDAAQNAIAFLEVIQTPPDPDPQIEERFQAVTKSPPFVPASIPAEVLEVPAEELARSLEEIEYIEMGWLFRLYHGKHHTCICRSCRDRYVRWLGKVAECYQYLYGGVPTEILTAIRFAMKSWEIVEKNRQA
jgi:hypothetical protein